MSKKLYENIEQLDNKIKEYFKINKINKLAKIPPRSPRHFRVYLGVSKHLLSQWRSQQPKYYNLIKIHEDQILADIEYWLLVNSYTESKEHKFNPVPLIFILRAYDKEQYIPEAQMEHTQDTPTQHIKINPINNSNNKLPVIEIKAKVKGE